MSWKSTVVLGVLAAATFGAWFLLKPVDEAKTLRPRPFDWREGTYQSIKIRRPDQPEIVLRRQPAQAVGSFWHMEQPLATPVDDSRVVEMIGALRRLTRDRSIKPGDPDFTPDDYGFKKPAATIEVSAAGDRRVLIFGNQSVRHTGARFYMIEGEPEIYLGPTDALPPFERSVPDYRSRQFFSLDPAKVVAVEVSRKFLRAGKDGKPGLETEYEKLGFEFREKPQAGRAAGWYLVSINGAPRDEKVETSKVGHVITGCRDLKAEEYVPLKNATDLGFGEPDLVVKFSLLDGASNAIKPLVVEVGRTDSKEARKVSYVRVDGSGEAAAVSAAFVERIPRDRKQFISAELIDFHPADLAEILLVMDSGHRVKLVKEEKEVPRGAEKYRQVNWKVVEPTALVYDQNAADEFAASIPQITVADILGEQPDLAAFGLANPAVTMTLTIKPRGVDPQDRVYKIGRPGDSRTGYLLKPGSNDVFQLADLVMRRLERADLNFRNPEMFNIPPVAIVGVAFSCEPDHVSALPQKFAVRKVDGGKWVFEDKANVDAKFVVDQDAMAALVGMLNYIKAEAFAGRGGRVNEDFKKEFKGELTIRYADPKNAGKATQITFLVTRPMSDASGQVRHYYAKIRPAEGDTSPSSDATIVFRIQAQIIEALRLGVTLQPR